MEIERIKAAIDITKAKLAFFSALVGGVSYLGVHIQKLFLLFPEISVKFLLTLLLLYGVSGVILALRELNKLKEKIWEEEISSS